MPLLSVRIAVVLSPALISHPFLGAGGLLGGALLMDAIDDNERDSYQDGFQDGADYDDGGDW